MGGLATTAARALLWRRVHRFGEISRRPGGTAMACAERVPSLPLSLSAAPAAEGGLSRTVARALFLSRMRHWGESCRLPGGTAFTPRPFPGGAEPEPIGERVMSLSAALAAEPLCPAELSSLRRLDIRSRLLFLSLFLLDRYGQ